ncbi:MAG: ATP-binding cassette domain-containing protein [Undibacterium sp.]
MTIFTISKSFSSSVERTPRVLEIAEGFGLGLTDKQFVVFENLHVDINQGDVVYITGQSGSGKSVLLKELMRQMKTADMKVRDLNDIVLEERPVIELVGANTAEATGYLARAGISDAWIYIRKPSELSDGQRYRLKLAILMSLEDSDIWVADEFGAVLDRVTAKVIAFNTQKLARSLGKTLMVATTHTDLGEELGPDLTVTKRFRERVDIVKKPAHEACRIKGSCTYSRSMDQAYPRKCIHCGTVESVRSAA